MRQLHTQAQPGLFRPSPPTDSQQVVQLYAVAAKVVCTAPSVLGEVTARLKSMAIDLVAPEAQAAAECFRLWQLFARVAQVPKPKLMREAGRAFCRDLDSLSQRLDLPPLDDWEALPTGIDTWVESHAAAGSGAGETPGPDPTERLAAVRAAARQTAQALARGQKFPSKEAAQLLTRLGLGERRLILEQLVGQGVLGRGDVNLLIRFFIRGDPLRDADTSLHEVLQRLGKWLAA